MWWHYNDSVWLLGMFSYRTDLHTKSFESSAHHLQSCSIRETSPEALGSGDSRVSCEHHLICKLQTNICTSYDKQTAAFNFPTVGALTSVDFWAGWVGFHVTPFFSSQVTGTGFSADSGFDTYAALRDARPSPAQRTRPPWASIEDSTAATAIGDALSRRRLACAGLQVDHRPSLWTCSNCTLSTSGSQRQPRATSVCARTPAFHAVRQRKSVLETNSLSIVMANPVRNALTRYMLVTIVTSISLVHPIDDRRLKPRLGMSTTRSSGIDNGIGTSMKTHHGRGHFLRWSKLLLWLVLIVVSNG